MYILFTEVYESVKRGIGEWEKYITVSPILPSLRFIMLQFNSEIIKRGNRK